MEDEFEELKTYLKDLKYPGINFMDDAGMTDIFGKQSRLYFLTWFFKKYDSDLILSHEEVGKVQILSDLLCENGFCSSEESVKFVEDNLQLSPLQQLEIFHKMLYNLNLLESTERNEETHVVNYLEQMKIFSNLDLNIFPAMGPLRTRTPEKRLQKLKQYEKDIVQLKREIECLNNECDVVVEENKVLNSSDILEDEIVALIKNSNDALKQKHVGGKDIFDENFKKVILNCGSNVSKISKLYENRKSINEFSVKNYCSKDDEKSSIISKRIKSLALLAEEVLNVS